MARTNRRQLGAGRGRARSAVGGVRRAWPYLLMAWERWQSLPEDEKERYRARAREAAAKGRAAFEQARGRGKRR